MGSLVMANAYIGPCASIGKFTFINTGAQVEHHNTIGDFVNVGPRVTTGGRVIIGARSVIGMSATISDHLTVGASSRIGAMSLVLSDILDDSKVFGIPAKEKLQ
jgi:UDP-3-O-[3-hydroxymyristoyl] glucosamine N-acyltransferase